MIKIKKRTWFLIGISIGLIVGIFIAKNFIPAKKLDYINIDFKNSENSSDVDESNESKKDETKSKLSKTTFDSSDYEKNTDSLNLKSDSTNFSDSISNDSLLKANLIDSLDMDSIWSWEDTITIDTNIYDYVSFDEYDSLNSKLLKDELFEVRYIMPLGKKSDFECDSYNELDSVLVDNNYRENQSQEFRVEFWKSPLNYRAYILTKNKLVLFGILKPDKVSLAYQKDGKIQLNYFDMAFELVCTKDLRPTILK